MAKSITGIVSSAKSDKTIVVTVQSKKTHPLYRKQYSVSRKFMAHDEKNEAEVGDKVSIIETRPLSARKRHVLDHIIEKPILREDSLSLTKVEEPVAATHEKVAGDKDSETEVSEA